MSWMERRREPKGCPMSIKMCQDVSRCVKMCQDVSRCLPKRLGDFQFENASIRFVRFEARAFKNLVFWIETGPELSGCSEVWIEIWRGGAERGEMVGTIDLFLSKISLDFCNF